jgi:hypothetical protein
LKEGSGSRYTMHTNLPILRIRSTVYSYTYPKDEYYLPFRRLPEPARMTEGLRLAWFSSSSPPGLLSQGTCPCSSGPAQVLLNKITVWLKKNRRYGRYQHKKSILRCSLESWRITVFYCLNVLRRGLGINILQFLIQKKIWIFLQLWTFTFLVISVTNADLQHCLEQSPFRSIFF